MGYGIENAVHHMNYFKSYDLCKALASSSEEVSYKTVDG